MPGGAPTRIPGCGCCCKSNCNESYCIDCDSTSTNCPSYGPSSNLAVCLKRDTHLPWDGCSKTSPPSQMRFDTDLSGTFTRTIRTCLKHDGTPCMNLAETKAKLRNTTNVYWSMAIKNGTTSCISVYTSCTVAGLPAGCTLQISMVGLNGSNWDCKFQYPTSTSFNGRVTFNGHCGNKCQDYQLFCFAARIVGPCSKCKEAVVTLSDFSFTVECPDSVVGHCKGVNDGCVSAFGCPMCCECCQPTLSTGLSKVAIGGGTKYCCENNYYLLSASSYNCTIYNPYGNCSNYGLDDCHDDAPSSYVLSCSNKPSGNCVLSRAVVGDPLFLYPCDCFYDKGPPTRVTSCVPVGIYYKGVDDCDNNTEPCNGSGGSGC